MVQPIAAVRRVQFCAGHRVLGHENKCRVPHGHNYVAFFHAEAASGLDTIGRVIDFGVLKERLGGWIEWFWDHSFIVAEADHELRAQLRPWEEKVFVLPNNPTAENMAAYLLHVVGPKALHGTGVTLTKVVLWETENCYAEARL